MLSNLECVFLSILDDWAETKWTIALLQEFPMSECLLPLAQTSLKARLDPVVTCSDTSETGGGMMYADDMVR